MYFSQILVILFSGNFSVLQPIKIYLIYYYCYQCFNNLKYWPGQAGLCGASLDVFLQ